MKTQSNFIDCIINFMGESDCRVVYDGVNHYIEIPLKIQEGVSFDEAGEKLEKLIEGSIPYRNLHDECLALKSIIKELEEYKIYYDLTYKLQNGIEHEGD